MPPVWNSSGFVRAGIDMVPERPKIARQDRRHDLKFDGVASYHELIEADRRRFIKAQHLLKEAFALYKGDDRCRLLAALLESVQRLRELKNAQAKAR